MPVEYILTNTSSDTINHYIVEIIDSEGTILAQKECEHEISPGETVSDSSSCFARDKSSSS